MTDPRVSHGRPSPRTLEEAIRETLEELEDAEDGMLDLGLVLRNQIAIMEVLRGMQVIQREPR